MENTPKGTRLHIALLGRRNAGKSSLLNALTNQEIALVSDIPGTTTDPVYKAMELLPLGPVMFIDTAGIDDEGVLGKMRVQKTYDVLDKTDVVLLVIDAVQGMGDYERGVLNLCQKKDIPFVIVINKEDLLDEITKETFLNQYQKDIGHTPCYWVSAATKNGLLPLKQHLMTINPGDWLVPAIVGDLLQPEDLVVLVVPIDTAAPKGRLILPQVQTIRDILDYHCMTMVCKEHQLNKALQQLKAPPKLVVTDSQVFEQVAAHTPPDVPLTSFSILMARYKGDLPVLARGAKTVDDLKPGDKILIAEACTHHQQPDDIGKVKIPRWLRQRVGGELQIDYCHGTEFPGNLEDYQLVVHCGGCMLNRREMLNRIRKVQEAGKPIVNYGVLIAHIHGIIPRALAPFGIDFSALE